MSEIKPTKISQLYIKNIHLTENTFEFEEKNIKYMKQKTHMGTQIVFKYFVKGIREDTIQRRIDFIGIAVEDESIQLFIDKVETYFMDQEEMSAKSLMDRIKDNISDLISKEIQL